MRQIEQRCDSCGSYTETPFCGMTEQGRAMLNLQKIDLLFPKGTFIFQKGEQPRGLYCLSSGLVKLENISKSGSSRILNILQSGDLLGHRALFSNQPYSSSAYVEEETVACFVSRETVLALVEKEPILALKLLGQISCEAKLSERRLCHASELSAPSRIADALLFLKENFRLKKWSRAEIAAWAGTTSETVVRSLARFEEEGLIELKGHRIEIINRPELEKRVYL